MRGNTLQGFGFAGALAMWAVVGCVSETPQEMARVMVNISAPEFEKPRVVRKVALVAGQPFEKPSDGNALIDFVRVAGAIKATGVPVDEGLAKNFATALAINRFYGNELFEFRQQMKLLKARGYDLYVALDGTGTGTKAAVVWLSDSYLDGDTITLAYVSCYHSRHGDPAKIEEVLLKPVLGWVAPKSE